MLRLVSHLGAHVDAPMHFIKRRLTIGAFPLKIKGGDGAPARIFAMED